MRRASFSSSAYRSRYASSRDRGCRSRPTRMFLPFARHSRSTPSKGQSRVTSSSPAEIAPSRSASRRAVKICFSAPSSRGVPRRRAARVHPALDAGRPARRRSACARRSRSPRSSSAGDQPPRPRPAGGTALAPAAVPGDARGVVRLHARTPRSRGGSDASTSAGAGARLSWLSGVDSAVPGRGPERVLERLARGAGRVACARRRRHARLDTDARSRGAAGTPARTPRSAFTLGAAARADEHRWASSDARARGRRTRAPARPRSRTPNKRNVDSEDRSQLRDISLKTDSDVVGGYRQRALGAATMETARAPCKTGSAEEPGGGPRRLLVVRSSAPSPTATRRLAS